VFGKGRTNLVKKCTNLSSKFGIFIVGEIEPGFFRRTLCAGNFLLGEKNLVKLTLGERRESVHVFSKNILN
jgi:hypothetical protein